jgi:hypothetical protein
MKTNKIVIAVIGSMAGMILSSCQTKENKLENAQENVIEANEDYKKAKVEFKNESEMMIRENENEIKMYRDNMKDYKVDERADYERRVDSLEKRNAELKRKLNEYDDNNDSNEKWESFKREFNHDMEGLKESLRSLSKNNVK